MDRPRFWGSFYVFGLSWKPRAFAWNVDGIARQGDQAKTHFRLKMYLILNLAVGGNWPGNPDNNTGFPVYFDIGYVQTRQQS